MFWLFLLLNPFPEEIISKKCWKFPARIFSFLDLQITPLLQVMQANGKVPASPLKLATLKMLL